MPSMIATSRATYADTASAARQDWLRRVSVPAPPSARSDPAGAMLHTNPQARRKFVHRNLPPARAFTLWLSVVR